MQDIYIIILMVILLLPLGYYLVNLIQRRRFLAKLKANWGKKEAIHQLDKDELADVAHYFHVQREHRPLRKEVDDTTWSDLDMDRIFQSLDSSTSVVGSEVLYALLREQGTSEEKLRHHTQLADIFRDNEGLRLQTQSALYGIGRRAFHGSWRYLFSAAFQYPSRAWVYPILALLPMTLALLGIVNMVFLLIAAGAFAVNLFVHYRTQAVWQKEVIAIKHIGAVLCSAKKLSKIKSPAFSSIRMQAHELNARLRSIRFWLPLFGAETFGDMAIVLEYLKIFFMLDMVSLVAIVKVINRNNEAVRAIYELAGEVDACLSIAQLKTRTPGLCSPSFHQECMLHAACLSHPLVQCSIPNDLIWQDNILISGSNATGKSTFIKAVAVNVILAQTINLCYAHQFSLRRGQVMSAMAVRDNIVAGESYFIVEIKSLKRILDAMGDDLVYCFIDEILRGTNTIERISASSAVLRSMIGQKVLCMAATHDIELTRMLVDCYRNLHFGEIVNEAGVQFDYILKEGPTQTRNAIRLLSQMGYQPEVIAQAHENARRFETTGSWL